MCNLNIFIKSQKGGFRVLTKFLKNVTNNSFQTNRDGDGVYFSGSDSLVTSLKKIKMNRYVTDIQESKFIITHQRISTSGFTSEYTQPFGNDEFVLAHNGIMSEFVPAKSLHSDTFSFFAKFMNEFTKQKGIRQSRVIKAIKELLDKQLGSFSIAIYDKKEGCMYYFKNYSTSINIYKSLDSKMLYMTTSWDNEKYLKRLPKEFKEKEIKDLTIYRIQVEESKKISIRKVDMIREKTYDYDKSSTTWTPRDLEEINDFNAGYGIRKICNTAKYMTGYVGDYRQVDVYMQCLYCEVSTDWVTTNGYPVCRECQGRYDEDQDNTGLTHYDKELTYTDDWKGYKVVLQKRLDRLDDQLGFFHTMYGGKPLDRRLEKKLDKLLSKRERAVASMEEIEDAEI